MSIEFTCPACGKAYRLKDELSGKSARCKCGQQLKIPDHKPEPTADLAALLEESEDPPTAAPPSLHKPKTAHLGVKKSATDEWHYGAFYPLKEWLESSGSAVVKLLVGAVAGALCGLKAISRDEGLPAMDLTTQVLMVSGAAIAGTAAASLLIIADVVRTRAQEGRSVPRILRWYFAAGWLSLALWIATVFVGAFVWLAIFAATQ